MLSLALASTQGLLIPHAKHGVNAAPTARGRVQAFFLSDESSRNPKSILDDEATCHLLTDSQKNAIHEMISSDRTPSDKEAILDNLFVECDEPSDDPGMTCFLTPESWIEGGSDELHRSKYLCMSNPDPTRSPLSMNGEDSY